MLPACHSSYPRLAYCRVPTIDDAKPPTAGQKKALVHLMYMAFVDIRALCLAGKTQQSKDLTDAFHNLPLMMGRPEFSLGVQRDFFVRYQEKHGVREGFDYVAELDKIAGMQG